jgi:hypothetical protein
LEQEAVMANIETFAATITTVINCSHQETAAGNITSAASSVSLPPQPPVPHAPSTTLRRLSAAAAALAESNTDGG